jgi:ribosomal protein L14E/L6E/L27E
VDIEKSWIVRSLAGRDKDRLFVVLNREADTFVLLCDGHIRRLENPKRKKVRHVAFVSRNETRMGDKIRAGEKITNAEIRRALRQLEGSDSDNG